jgi:hypothetical protein
VSNHFNVVGLFANTGKGILATSIPQVPEHQKGVEKGQPMV